MVEWSSYSTLLVFMGLLGGLGFFLLGMEQLSLSMKNLAGRQMRFFLNSVAENRIKAALFGILFTILFQSSSASSVVLIGFVESGLLTFAQSLPVIIGTAFGTTITAQLVAFKIGTYSLLGVGFGFIGSMMSAGKSKAVWKVLLSLGLIFYGMDLMSGAMQPLKNNPAFMNIMLQVRNPIIGLIVGLIGTALIQSSAAFIGILITLGSSGLLAFDATLAMVLGANIGTTVTGVISSINSSYEAKKVAWANTVFKALTALLFILVIKQWGLVTEYISGSNANLGRLIANAHTIFNFALLVIWLPLIYWFAKVFEKYIANKKQIPEFTLHYLTDDVLNSPQLSLSLLKKEILLMGHIVEKMVQTSLLPFVSKDANAIGKIKIWEQETDKFREKINGFWVRSAHVSSRDSWPKEVYQLLHLMNELEQIADIVAVSIGHQAEKWIEMNASFSDAGRDELIIYHSKCVKQMHRALQLVENRNYGMATKMKEKYRKYAYMAFDLELNHYKRLYTPDSKSLESSKIHLELLNLYRIINSRSTNFGRLVLMDEQAE